MVDLPQDPHEDTEATVIRQKGVPLRAEVDIDEDTVIRAPAELTPLVEPPAWVERPAIAIPGPEPEQAMLVYSFVVNAHDPISLDVPALLGRRPSIPRIPTGDRPRLVRVPSPLGEVSGTHLELRQQGGTVVVTDLQSTNGTVVLIPGQPSRKLLQGESVVVAPGSVVDIGDGNVIEILPARAIR